MFCSKCGKQLPEGTKFCTECGTPVQSLNNTTANNTAYAPAQNNYAAPYQGGYAAPVQAAAAPKKSGKKLGKILGITGGCVVGAAAVVALVAVIGGGSRFAKLTKSDDEYLEYVNKNDVEEFYEILDEVGEDLDDLDKTYSGSVEVKIEDGAQNYIAQLMPQLKDKIKEIALDYEVTKNGDKSKFGMNAKLNGTSILDMATILDTEANKCYISIEDYLKKNISLDLNEMLEDTPDILGSLLGMISGSDHSVSVSGAATMLPSAAANAVKEEDGRSLVKKYVNMIIESLRDVETEKTTLSAGEISQSCTKYTVVIDDQKLADLFIKVLTEAKNDQKLRSFITDLIKSMIPADMLDEGVSVNDYAERYTNEAINKIDELLKDVEEYKNGGEPEPGDKAPTITLITYIAKNGDVIGRELTVNDNGDITRIYYYVPTSKGEYCLEAKIVEDDGYFDEVDTLLSISASGKVKKGTYNGHASLVSEGEKLIDVDFEGFNPDDLLDGKYSGSYTFIPAPALLEEIDLDCQSVKLTVKPEGNNTKLKCDFTLSIDNADMITVSFSYKESKAEKVKAPSDSISVNEFKEEDVDLNVLKSNLKKAGLDIDELLRGMGIDDPESIDLNDLISSLLGGGNGGYDDYDDWDDWDY